MKYRAINFTCAGDSHAKSGKECQDASVSVNESGLAIAAVSDGHGGSEYFRSGKGAELAAASAKELAAGFARSVSREELAANHHTLLRSLAKDIAADWRARVERHRKENPFTDEELDALPARAREIYMSGANAEYAYGATLLVAAAAENFWFGLQIGDGKCVVKTQKGFVQPIPWDERCFLNVTTSLCDAYAFDEFRYCWGEGGESGQKFPEAIFIASDGIDGCFAGDAQLYSFYDALLSLFGQYEPADAERELSEYLPTMSAKGSGDDMSVAALLQRGK